MAYLLLSLCDNNTCRQQIAEFEEDVMNVALKQGGTQETNAGTRSGTARPRRGKRDTGNQEKRILELLKKGDQEALREIMRKYHEKLFSVANRICNNPADAEEILQDVYMVALNKIDRFEERSTLSTWLYRITVNAALMKLRSQRANKGNVPIDGYTALLGEDENILRFDEAVRPPDENLMVKELYGKIKDCVETLPDIYQSVFFLRDVQGYSIKETSRMLHTTPAAIKSRLHRSRFFLREKLDQYLSHN
jgi:RNA polymerase sigma-70 factor (ECF subfamily)